MLDRSERDRLRQIESTLEATDPELAARLRHGQRRLPRAGRASGKTVPAVLLVVLAVVLLVLHLPISAVEVAALAVALWWFRKERVGRRRR
jgi:Flp pilus assembly protein TadB